MYKEEKLNYEYNGLVPVLSGDTIFVHYEKHYKNYLNKLNSLLKSINYKFNDSIEDLILNIDKIPMNSRGDVLYNAGAVLNHELYFNNMNKNDSHVPVNEIKVAIDKKYGSFEDFKKEFISEATKLVGSGYTFLVLNKDNELQIINMVNQESPLSYGFIPIMTIDLWEHAYYLDYQNKRNEYINNFFEIVSFDVINENYKKAIK